MTSEWIDISWQLNNISVRLFAVHFLLVAALYIPLNPNNYPYLVHHPGAVRLGKPGNPYATLMIRGPMMKLYSGVLLFHVSLKITCNGLLCRASHQWKCTVNNLYNDTFTLSFHLFFQ